MKITHEKTVEQTAWSLKDHSSFEFIDEDGDIQYCLKILEGAICVYPPNDNIVFWSDEEMKEDAMFEKIRIVDSCGINIGF